MLSIVQIPCYSGTAFRYKSLFTVLEDIQDPFLLPVTFSESFMNLTSSLIHDAPNAHELLMSLAK